MIYIRFLRVSPNGTLQKFWKAAKQWQQHTSSRTPAAAHEQPQQEDDGSGRDPGEVQNCTKVAHTER